MKGPGRGRCWAARSVKTKGETNVATEYRHCEVRRTAGPRGWWSEATRREVGRRHCSEEEWKPRSSEEGGAVCAPLPLRSAPAGDPRSFAGRTQRARANQVVSASDATV
jgi:hypothetical protein